MNKNSEKSTKGFFWTVLLEEVEVAMLKNGEILEVKCSFNGDMIFR